MKRLKLSFVLMMVLGLASGQTFQTGGNWNTASNWNPASVPSGTSTDVTLNANPTFNSGANNLIGNIAVSNNVQITVNANATLTVGSSTLFNAGTKKSITIGNSGQIQINSGSPDGSVIIWGDLIVNNSLQLQVSGNLTVYGNITMNNNAQIQVSGGGVVTVGGNLSGGNNTQVTVSGTGSSLAVTGSLSIGGGSSSLSVSGGGTISAGSCSCTGCPSNNGCSSDVVLPIILLDFDAFPTSNSVVVKWTTASELDFDYFSVQRSIYNAEFKEIGRVSGAGRNTFEVRHYEFVDHLPQLGDSYYRIVSVDLDGSQESFSATKVNYQGSLSVLVHPNPAPNGELTLNLNFDPDSSTHLQLCDLSGSKLAEIPITERSTKISLNVQAGTYLAKIKTPEGSKSIRIVVAH